MWNVQFSVIPWGKMPYNLVDKKRILSAAFVKGVRYWGKPYGPDKYYDEHGLILRVIPTGGKQWMRRGTVHGNRVDLGLGGWPYVSPRRAKWLSTTASWRGQVAIPVRSVPGSVSRPLRRLPIR